MRKFSEELEFFKENGYVIGREVLTEDDLAPVMARLNDFVDQEARRLHAAGRVQDLCEGQSFQKRIVSLYRQDEGISENLDIMHSLIPACFEFLHNERLLDFAEAFLGPEITCNPIQHIRAKMPASISGDVGYQNVPWHQDVGVTLEDSDPSLILTFWLPLVEANKENGCMEVLPGCLDVGCLTHVKGPTGTEIDPKVRPDVTPVAAECRPGDVIVMSKYTPHRGLANTSEEVRWSLDLRYQVTGQPTGRYFHPDFPVRSSNDPASVQRDYAWWCKAWKEALANSQGQRFHRVTAS